jgi:hypothetical protein
MANGLSSPAPSAQALEALRTHMSKATVHVTRITSMMQGMCDNGMPLSIDIY